VSNKSEYEIETLTDWLDQLLTKRLLPSEDPTSGFYRTDFRETVSLQYVNLGDLLVELGHDASSIPADVSSNAVIIETTITSYRVIAPSQVGGVFPVRIETWTSDLPMFPPEKRVHFWVGHDEPSAEHISIKTEDDPQGGVNYTGQHTLKFTNGVCVVWAKLVEVRAAESEAWILNIMNMPTYKLETVIYLAGSEPRLSFEGRVTGGLGLEPQQKSHLPNGLSLVYNGWLLEDHGYFAWWWKEVPQKYLHGGPPAKTAANATVLQVTVTEVPDT
jgi:hypothetical protein